MYMMLKLSSVLNVGKVLVNIIFQYISNNNIEVHQLNAVYVIIQTQPKKTWNITWWHVIASVLAWMLNQNSNVSYVTSIHNVTLTWKFIKLDVTIYYLKRRRAESLYLPGRNWFMSYEGARVLSFRFVRLVEKMSAVKVGMSTGAGRWSDPSFVAVTW